MPAHEPTPPAAQGAFRPRLIQGADSHVDALHGDLEHQRMVEETLRNQYALLKQSFDALMDTNRAQFADLTEAREKRLLLEPLKDEVAELQETLRIARETQTAAALQLMKSEARVIEAERLRIQLEAQHLKELNARSQAAQECLRELNDLRGDLEIARRNARRVKRELTVAESSERALEAYSDRLEKQLGKAQDPA